MRTDPTRAVAKQYHTLRAGKAVQVLIGYLRDMHRSENRSIGGRVNRRRGEERGGEERGDEMRVSEIFHARQQARWGEMQYALAS